MSKKTITIITCDLCGAEIDTSDEHVSRNSMYGDFSYIPVYFHNPNYDEGYQTGITTERLDLCPTCADRAAMIHQEVECVNGGHAFRYVYSWRDGR